MPRSNEHDFIPFQVDEQIENHLAVQDSGQAAQAGQRAVQQLQRLHQIRNDEHAPSLERVWQRVQASEPLEIRERGLLQTSEEGRAIEAQEEPRQSGVLASLSQQERHQGRPRRRRLLFTQLAAVLALVVIVGGFVFINNSSPKKQLLLLTQTGGSGLYGYLNNALYRLDGQTHRIIWKHTFASNEFVQGDAFAGTAPERPFVVGGILYLETRDNQHTDRQYVYAFNAADGAVLWRQLSARVLATSAAVYTLVESKTSSSSTLTARDPHTGQQLWQRQYPVAGAKSDPAYGTDGTEGFRLITVTNQLLYAVVAYRQNGQNIFARYGLSPTDGSILWQNHEELAGRMPQVTAQVVNGVIYTLEYNLKPVTPSHIDSHGMTMTEIPQSRVAAYDQATGHQRWQTSYMAGEQPNGDFYLSASNDTLYFQTYNNLWPETSPKPNALTTLHALSTSNGAQRWQYQKKSDNDFMTGAVLSGDSLYFEAHTLATIGGKQDLQLQIVALNAQTGEVRWSTPVKLLDGSEKTPTPIPGNFDPGFTGGYAVDMAPLVYADTVYYSTPGNRIYAIQASDGKILTQFWVDKTTATTVLSRLTLFVGP